MHHIDEYETRPGDADEKEGNARYIKRNSIIKLDVCMSAVFHGLTETMNWYGECHMMEKLRPWIGQIEGEVVKFKHNESFGVKFKPGVSEAEIKRRLVWVREQWKKEVMSMEYYVEQHI